MPYKPTGRPPGRPSKPQQDAPVSDSPAVALTETPEFKDAVKDALSSMRESLLADLKASLVGAKAEDQVDIKSIFSQMALSIAEMNDQGSDRKRIDPAVLAAREAAKDRMGALILKARELPHDKRPRYKLIGKTYLKERFIEPFQRLADKRIVPTEIFWTNAPNGAMRPVNDSAKRIYKEFLEWMGGSTELAGLVKVPQWVTNSGAMLANGPNASGALHSALPNPFDLDDPMAVGGNGAVDEDDTFEVISQSDPRAPEIHVLGTVAPPAKRMVPGERSA